MLKNASLHGKSQMENRKSLAICHLPFAIADQAGIFQRPARTQPRSPC
jgi:hypothetical protein